MARSTHTVRRAGTYHFRRVIPAALRPRLGRRELVRSLDTHAPDAAKLRADLLYRSSEKLFAAAASPMLPPDALARLVRDFYDLVLTIDDHHRLFDGSVDDERNADGAAYLDGLVAEHRQALARNRFDEAGLAATVAMRRSGINPEALGPGELNQIRQAILRAGIDVAEALRARHDGDFNHEPRDKLLQTTLHQPSAAGAIAQVPSRSPEPSAPAAVEPTGPLLSTVGAAFRESQVATSAWDHQTAQQASSTYRLFAEVCGDKPLAAYTRRDAGQFRDRIERLPNNYGKNARYRDLSVDQILSAHAALPAKARTPVVTQRTVKRHFSALSALWGSAVPKGEAAENIFSGFRFVGAKKASEQRDMWERDELAHLFATPVWKGAKSAIRRSTPGPLVLQDEKFWLPLVAVFSGLRQEEICQLHVEDVREEAGVAFLDINNRPPRKLKNASAVRQVPVHAELIRLGFLAYVDAQRRAGHARVFPDLSPGGADGRLGHAFTKWFTRYRRDVGLYRPGLDFHSFRHTATTLMHQAGVERAVIDHVTGHTTPGETARYTKRSSLPQLKAAIDSIDPGVDFAAAPVGRRQAPRPRRPRKVRLTPRTPK